MKHFRTLIIFVFAILSSCGTVTRESVTLPSAPPKQPVDRYTTLNYQSANGDLYEKYLVRIDSYTTKGNVYHEKHIKYLRGIAEILTVGKHFNVSEQSIGFYYDKVKNEKEKLYLGLDIQSKSDEVSTGATYIENGRGLVTIYVQPVLSVLRSYEDILSEDEIEGVVIALYWTQSSKKEFVTIWFSKQNVKDYFNGHMTLNELIIKSTITNTEGKQIRLAL